MNKLMLSSSFIVIALSGCGNNNPLYAPEVNPNPKYFMTVKGHIDTELSKLLQLQILPEYQANNPNCKYIINWLEGVSAPVYRDVTYTARPDANGNYSVQVPIDYYQSGKCQWAIQSINYFLHGAGYSARGVADFRAAADLSKNFLTTASTRILCNKNLTCYWDEVEFYDKEIPKNHSYTYHLDIERKGYGSNH